MRWDALVPLIVLVVVFLLGAQDAGRSISEASGPHGRTGAIIGVVMFTIILAGAIYITLKLALT